jgi:hypothetical protein
MSEPSPHTESELVEFVRSADVRAPDALHGRVRALVDERSPARRRRRFARRSIFASSPRRGHGSLGLRLGGVVALAVAVAALVLALAGGGAPTVSSRQVSKLTLREATAPAPEESMASRGQLTAAVQGVAFPYWKDRFGWRATGMRTDRVDGRTVTTVFYGDRQGGRIGYAIVSGTTASRPRPGRLAWWSGTPYRLLSVNGTPTVTWLRRGHLCVVSGRGVDSATLLRLASWGGHEPQSS